MRASVRASPASAPAQEVPNPVLFAPSPSQQGDHELETQDTTDLFYLDSCVPGDANELFWVVSTGGIDPAGAVDRWFIS